MVRWQRTLLALASACCVLGAVTPASAAEPAALDPAVTAGETDGVVTAPAPLKRWTIAITAAAVNRDDITEIDRVDAPASEADRRGGGVGLSFGYLFGDRFLLALQGILAHPTLGEAEIGGFHPKFFSQNGPTHVLEDGISRQALFNLAMSKQLPLIDDVDTQVRTHRGDDSTTYEVTVSWTNSGQLPSALRQAQLVKIVQEDRVRLVFDDSLTDGDTPQLKIVSPSRRNKTIAAGWTEPGEQKAVTFEVRTYGVSSVEGTVHVLSTRGGLVKVPLVLGER